MSDFYADVAAIRAAAVGQLQTLLATTGPVVATASGDLPWTPWLDDLHRLVDWCDAKLAANDPFEAVTRGVAD